MRCVCVCVPNALNARCAPDVLDVLDVRDVRCVPDVLHVRCVPDVPHARWVPDGLQVQRVPDLLHVRCVPNGLHVRYVPNALSVRCVPELLHAVCVCVYKYLSLVTCVTCWSACAQFSAMSHLPLSSPPRTRAVPACAVPSRLCLLVCLFLRFGVEECVRVVCDSLRSCLDCVCCTAWCLVTLERER